MHSARRFLIVIATALCLAALVPSVSASSPRSGDFQLTKDCSQFTGAVGDFCTVTSANVKAIPIGAKIFYAQALVYPLLDSDVVLVAGPGNRAAGHCALSLATGIGRCTFSGGTGQFTHFHAGVDVSYLGGPNWAWNGWYDLSPRD
jgi:hypothetical protein